MRRKSDVTRVSPFLNGLGINSSVVEQFIKKSFWLYFINKKILSAPVTSIQIPTEPRSMLGVPVNDPYSKKPSWNKLLTIFPDD